MRCASLNLAAVLLAGGLVLSTQAQAGAPAAAAACAGCHGDNGVAVAPNFPNLAGQQKKYLLNELNDYKSGKRISEVMVPMIAGLSEADLAALAAYYAKQDAAEARPGNAALTALGKTLYLKGNPKNSVPSCDGCHEENGYGDGKFPRVAGQQVDYLLEQFRLYATGKRGNGTRVMQTVAERLSEQEIRALAEYMASMQ